ncbi:MAG: MlaE family ABC transporter permease [Gammaproteobacteria bacterium]
MKQMAEITLLDNQLVLSGYWDLTGLTDLKQKFSTLVTDPEQIKTIDVQGIQKLDIAGALFLSRLIETIGQPNIIGLNEEQKRLIALVKKNEKVLTVEVEKTIPPWLEIVGRKSVYFYRQLLLWLYFIGEIFITLVNNIIQPQKLRVKFLLKTIETNGFLALPIVGFLAFLIGVVLTYQAGLQLRNYGANIFIIDLLGIATFREFAPLITSIIIAGRTGSAFTAQLGLMKANEEIDALRTMGYSPTELLVLPRILGLIIAMPLLVVWADIFGILGGMVMSKNILGINYLDFIHEFPYAVTLTSFSIGIIKAPVFALIIAAVGCFHGFRVTGSSESIGLQTTKSVVLAIFLIIAADAIFSVILSWLNI